MANIILWYTYEFLSKINRYKKSITFQTTPRNKKIHSAGGALTLLAIIIILVYAYKLIQRLMERTDMVINQTSDRIDFSTANEDTTITEFDEMEFRVFIGRNLEASLPMSALVSMLTVEMNEYTHENSTSPSARILPQE